MTNFPLSLSISSSLQLLASFVAFAPDVVSLFTDNTMGRTPRPSVFPLKTGMSRLKRERAERERERESCLVKHVALSTEALGAVSQQLVY